MSGRWALDTSGPMNETHVVPVADVWTHVYVGCECGPTVERVQCDCGNENDLGRLLVVHHSLDGRDAK